MMAGVLGYGVGEGLIPYLGLKVGGRIGGTKGWKEVVERVKKQIRSWDTKAISFGGRVTLIKSILSSIPLYTMSFLRLLVKTEKEIRAILRNFLWVREESGKK